MLRSVRLVEFKGAESHFFLSGSALAADVPVIPASKVLPDPEEGQPRVIYSYVFPNGFTEHTVIWLTEKDDPTSGWTIVVEPLSGNVRLD